MKRIIQLVLLGLAVLFAYMLYDSIASEIEFNEEIAKRKEVVIKKLEDIRDAQIAYKSVKGKYAKTFPELIQFLEKDSMPLIYAEGEVPDSLIGQEAKAIELGIIKRDTSLIPVKDTLFKGRFNEVISDLSIIPFSGGKEFIMDAGEVERGKVKVKVFEVKAPYKYIYNGLDTKNRDIDLEDGLILGSMVDPTTNGNW
jgi:hypothetical protein